MRELYSGGGFGLRLTIMGDLDRRLTDNDQRALQDAIEAAMKALVSESNRLNPDYQQSKAVEKKMLLDCFPEPIYVKEIPNGYCSQPCCVMRPWYVVTTKVGPITIGWRKRVIEIDWSNSDLRRHVGVELFKGEDVTKGDHYVHAWGYDKAKEYITRLFSIKPDA